MYGLFTTPITNPLAGTSGTSVYLLAIIIAVVVTMRMYRGIKGAKFSKSRLFRTPVIYFVLTAFSLLAYYGAQYFYYLVTGAIAMFAIGTLIGLKHASGVEFFERDGTTHYRRAPYILLVWMAAFIARIFLEFAYPNLVYVALLVTLLLSFSTGLILGEALHISEKHKTQMTNKQQRKGEQGSVYRGR